MPLLLLYYICVIFAISYLVCFCFSPFTVEPVGRKYQILGRDRRLPDDLRFAGGEVPLATTQDIQESLVSMLGSVREVLHDQGVTFWAVGHTLFGCHVASGLLPWVDSVELGFFFDRKEHVRLLSCRPALQEAGLQLTKRRNTYRITRKGYCFPYVDMWLMAERESEVAVCTPLSELNECTFRDSYHHHVRNHDMAHVFPLKPGQFEGLAIPLPSDPEACIRSHFGDNFRTVDWGSTSHMFNTKTRAVVSSFSEAALKSISA